MLTFKPKTLKVRLAAALAVAATVTTAAMAANYPDRTIRMISPHPAGVATDVIGRTLALKLQETLGQPVVMENHPGANGIIAEGLVAKATPDGYTLLITSGAHIANTFVTKSLPFDVIKDFAPVTETRGILRARARHQPPREISAGADRTGQGKARPTDLCHQRRGQHYPCCGPAIRGQNRHQDGRRAV